MTAPDIAVLMAADPALEKLLAIDAELAAIGPKIHLLRAIEWPAGIEEQFLATFRAGRAQLPQVPLVAPDLRRECAQLDALMQRCDAGHPIGRWLCRNAWSYRVAAQMLMDVGSREFTVGSVKLYGRPDQRYPGQSGTNLELAEGFLKLTDELIGGHQVPTAICDIPAEQFVLRVQPRIAGFFAHDTVKVVLNPHLASKAAAGSAHVDVRSDALFSELDVEQLIQHEAFVHTATLINGKHQPFLKTLGLGAPRTTRDQEGIASFAEIISDAIDISRLRRLALRVREVQHALDGADFIDVFKGFLAAGQSDSESFKSAERIFRGGDPKGGGICLTKDGAYLDGVMRVYTFLRKVLQDDRPQLIDALFCGRLTVADVVELQPWFENGLIAGPLYIPPWAQDLRRLLAVLAFFTLTGAIQLDDLALQHFVEQEAESLAQAGYSHP